MKSLLLILPILASTTNPIEQVLDLLQKLRDTVVADGEVEQKQFEKFSEWCEDAARGRQNDIKTAIHAYSKDLLESCQQRAVEFDIRKKSRGEELKALEYAKEILSEKTGAATKRQYSLLQLQAGESNGAIGQIVRTIASLGRKEHSSLLLKLASQIRATRLNGRPVMRVKELIDEMIKKLLAKAEEDATRRSFCDEEMSTSRRKLRRLRGEKSSLSTQIDRATADVESLKQAVTELEGAIAHIEESQMENDRLRAEQHEEFVKAKADFEQGLEGVHTALHVLRDYYERSGSAWIIDILEIAEQDFARSLQEGQVAEDHHVQGYEHTTQDNSVSTETKRASVERMTQESARLEQMIIEARDALNGSEEEQKTVEEYLERLRPQCNTAEPDRYQRRKARRDREIESLENAMEVLQAQEALVQRRRPRFRSRHFLTIQ